MAVNPKPFLLFGSFGPAVQEMQAVFNALPTPLARLAGLFQKIKSNRYSAAETYASNGSFQRPKAGAAVKVR